MKQYKGLNIRPGLRTLGLFVPIFGFVLIYNQFRDIKRFAKEAGVVKTYTPSVILGAFIGVGILASFLPKPHSFLLSTLPLYVVQKTLNDFWNVVQPELQKRTFFSPAQIALLVLGSLSWGVGLRLTLSPPQVGNNFDTTTRIATEICLEQENPNSLCIEHLVGKGIFDNSKCEEITKRTEFAVKDGCYYNAALYADDVTLCEKISRTNPAEACRIVLAKDYVQCRKLARDDYWEKRCYLDTARITKDFSVCEQFPDKPVCHAKIAMYYDDISLCKQLSTQKDAELCENAFELEVIKEQLRFKFHKALSE